MKEVYGDWDNPNSGFPVPMPNTEAGPDLEANDADPACQRRYLWTDSFGILNPLEAHELQVCCKGKDISYVIYNSMPAYCNKNVD